MKKQNTERELKEKNMDYIGERIEKGVDLCMGKVFGTLFNVIKKDLDERKENQNGRN